MIFWRGVGKRRESPLPRWQAFLQASVVPTLAGGCLGRPTWSPRYVRSVSTHPTLATRCFLRAKWSLLARLRAGVFTCKVFLRCRDACSAWRDDFRRLVGVWCGAVTRSGLVRHFCTTQLRPCRCSFGGLSASAAVTAVHSSMPKWESSFPMAIPTALMRGHTHAGEVSLYCQQAFGCPAGMPTRREGTLSKINLSERRCEHATVSYTHLTLPTKRIV